MDGHRCVRCNNYWASQSGNPERFDYITAWCPNCLPLLSTTHLDAAGPPPPRPRHYRRHDEGLIRRVG